MKKFFALLASFFIIAMLAACNSDDSQAQGTEDGNKTVENEIEVKD
ncbi:hypothetical protein [Siminovitchia acidinfaciens]|nr:hypothetical protein [Siminovitchia acidinfaciens]